MRGAMLKQLFGAFSLSTRPWTRQRSRNAIGVSIHHLKAWLLPSKDERAPDEKDMWTFPCSPTALDCRLQRCPLARLDSCVSLRVKRFLHRGERTPEVKGHQSRKKWRRGVNMLFALRGRRTEGDCVGWRRGRLWELSLPSPDIFSDTSASWT